jgi:Leucine-rich repeat (LRR) protein
MQIPSKPIMLFALIALLAVACEETSSSDNDPGPDGGTDGGTDTDSGAGPSACETRYADETTVNFADPDLEALVRDVISKPTGTITYLEVKRVNQLNGAENNIFDPSGIEYLTCLTVLDLFNNKIVDISKLDGLTNLTRLYLEDNQIVDIGGLSGLTNLVVLDLDNNLIEDISAIVANAGLGSGDEVSLFGNPLACDDPNLVTLESRGVVLDTSCP